jgi:hypothetical protein
VGLFWRHGVNISRAVLEKTQQNKQILAINET